MSEQASFGLGPLFCPFEELLTAASLTLYRQGNPTRTSLRKEVGRVT
jgi:hypothetical protein